MTEITSNGSKWAGQAPDPVSVLIEVLAREPLDRTFEKYGNFAINEGNGIVRFFGNFLTVSHVFNIRTDDPELVATLIAAIKANKRMPAYQAQPTPAQADAERERQQLERARVRRRLGR